MGTSRAGIADKEPVRRACDRCHVRKVKCDGVHPCGRCAKKNETCTFDNPILPKGPTPRRQASIYASTSSSRYQPYGVRESIRKEPPTVLEGLEELVSTETSNIWEDMGIDPFADWTDLFGSRAGSTLRSRVPSRVPSRSGTRPTSPRFDNVDSTFAPEDTSTWVMTRTRPSTPGFSVPDFLRHSNTGSNAMVPAFDMAEPTFGLGLTGPLFNIPFTPPEDISPILTLTLETLIKPQLDIFFIRIFPMMPVFPPSYTFSRLSDPNSLRCPDFVAMILSMSALSLIHPLMSHEMVEKVTRAKKAKVFLDEAGRLMARWDHGSNVTLEAVMAKYLMFGTLFELGHTGPARLRLRESIHLGAEMYLDKMESYTNLDAAEVKRRLRMYWVLAVTERAYAVQRSGSLIFNGGIKRITHVDLDPPSISLHYLTQVFSFLDQDMITCWNNQCPRAFGQTCHYLTRDRASSILKSLSGGAPEVFGEGSEINLKQLTDSQRADLFITWQWIKNRVWRLAALHGVTTEDGPPELGVEYVVSAAATTVAICRRLPLSAMEAHGTGFLEKLYDIGSILTNLLQSPSIVLQTKLVSIIQSTSWGETLESLYSFLSLHRGGTNDFASQLAQAIRIAGSLRLVTNGNM